MDKSSRIFVAGHRGLAGSAICRRLRRDGWFDPEAVATLRRGEDRPGEFRRRRVGEKLWTLLMFHLWRDGESEPSTWPTNGRLLDS